MCIYIYIIFGVFDRYRNVLNLQSCNQKGQLKIPHVDVFLSSYIPPVSSRISGPAIIDYHPVIIPIEAWETRFN